MVLVTFKGFRRDLDLKTFCVFNMNVSNSHEVTTINRAQTSP